MFALVSTELKKIIQKKYVWIVLAVLTVFWIYRVGYQQSKSSAYMEPDDVRNYILSMSGPLTEKKYNQITENYNLVMDGNEGEQSKGILTSSAENDMLAVEYLKEDADYILTQDKNRVAVINQARRNLERLAESGDNYQIKVNQKIIDMYGYFDELVISPLRAGWKFYFSENSHTLLLIIFLIITLAPVFSAESESHMLNIIYPSAAGRGKTAAAKLFTVVIISGVSAVFFEAVNFLCYFCNYYMKNFDMTIRNMPAYAASPFNITVGQYALIKLGLFVLFGVLTGLIIAFFSKLFARTVPALISDLIIIGGSFGVTYFFVAPAYIVTSRTPGQLALEGSLVKWLFTFITNPDIYFSEFNAVNIFGSPVLVHNIIITVCVLSCILLAATTYLLHTKNISLRRD